MGGFLGHFLPGMYVWLLGLWWVMNIARQHFNSRLTNGRPYRAHFYYVSTLFGNWPMESLIKLGLGVYMVQGELRAGYKYGSTMAQEVQHVVTDTAFFICGLLEVLHHRRRVAGNKSNMNDSLEPIGLLLLSATTTFILRFHLHGRALRDTQLHILFTYTTMALVASILLERWHGDWVPCSMVRAISLQTAGTWITHTGLIVYPEYVGLHKGTGQDDPEQLQFTLLLFTLHWMANLGITLLVTATVHTLSPCSASKSQK